MNKINFQNLPNQTTPVNAINLNQLQTNVDNGKVETEVNAVNNIDANDCDKSGFYYLGSGCSNVPESWIRLIVNGATGSNDLVQFATGMSTGNIYMRKKSNNSWGNWTDISPMKSGTWTPSINTRANVAPTVTYSARNGTYKKIGNMVFISFYCRGKITALNDTNNYAVISGLPFKPVGYSLGGCALSLGVMYNFGTAQNNPVLDVRDAYNGQIYCQYNDGNGAITLKLSESSDFQIGGSGWYEIA